MLLSAYLPLSQEMTRSQEARARFATVKLYDYLTGGARFPIRSTRFRSRVVGLVYRGTVGYDLHLKVDTVRVPPKLGIIERPTQ